jgi:hypothetical protein
MRSLVGARGSEPPTSQIRTRNQAICTRDLMVSSSAVHVVCGWAIHGVSGSGTPYLRDYAISNTNENIGCGECFSGSSSSKTRCPYEQYTSLSVNRVETPTFRWAVFNTSMGCEFGCYCHQQYPFLSGPATTGHGGCLVELFLVASDQRPLVSVRRIQDSFRRVSLAPQATGFSR